MQKLLVYCLMMLGLNEAEAAPTPQTLSISLVIPEGAQTFLVNFGGQTFAQPLLTGPKTLRLEVRVEAKTVSVNVGQSFNEGSTGEAYTLPTKLLSPLGPAVTQRLTPRLNGWFPLWSAEREATWLVNFGGWPIFSRPKTLSVTCLFTAKPASQIRSWLQPPRLP